MVGGIQNMTRRPPLQPLMCLGTRSVGWSLKRPQMLSKTVPTRRMLLLAVMARTLWIPGFCLRAAGAGYTIGVAQAIFWLIFSTRSLSSTSSYLVAFSSLEYAYGITIDTLRTCPRTTGLPGLPFSISRSRCTLEKQTATRLLRCLSRGVRARHVPIYIRDVIRLNLFLDALTASSLSAPKCLQELRLYRFRPAVHARRQPALHRMPL